MIIRHSKEEDLPRMMEIYAYARDFMAEHGNPNQWGPTNWPPEGLIRADIAAGNSYVCVCKDRPYGVVHRLAGDGSVKGIGSACLEWAFGQCGHLRIDTHGDNRVMQNLLKKSGFVYCGIIHVEEDCYPRLAYEKLRTEGGRRR